MPNIFDRMEAGTTPKPKTGGNIFDRMQGATPSPSPQSQSGTIFDRIGVAAPPAPRASESPQDSSHVPGRSTPATVFDRLPDVESDSPTPPDKTPAPLATAGLSLPDGQAGGATGRVAVPRPVAQKPTSQFNEYRGRARTAVFEAEDRFGRDSDEYRKAQSRYKSLNRVSAQQQQAASEQLDVQEGEQIRFLGALDAMAIGGGQATGHTAKSAGSIANMLAAPFGKQPGKSLYEWGLSREEMAQAAEGIHKSIVDDPSQALDPRWWLKNFTEQSIYYVPMLLGGAGLKALGVGAKGATLFAGILAGAQESGADFEDLVREGVKGPEAAARAALSMALIGALNTIPMFRQLRRMGKMSGRQQLRAINRDTAKTIGRAIMSGIKQFILEGGEEYIEEPIQLLTRELGRTPGAELQAKMGQTLLDALEVFLVAGPMGAMTDISTQSENRKRLYNNYHALKQVQNARREARSAAENQATEQTAEAILQATGTDEAALAAMRPEDTLAPEASDELGMWVDWRDARNELDAAIANGATDEELAPLVQAESAAKKVLAASQVAKAAEADDPFFARYSELRDQGYSEIEAYQMMQAEEMSARHQDATAQANAMADDAIQRRLAEMDVEQQMDAAGVALPSPLSRTIDALSSDPATAQQADADNKAKLKAVIQAGSANVIQSAAPDTAQAAGEIPQPPRPREAASGAAGVSPGAVSPQIIDGGAISQPQAGQDNEQDVQAEQGQQRQQEAQAQGRQAAAAAGEGAGQGLPVAEFIGFQEDVDGSYYPLYNVPLENGRRTTVTAETLQDMGVDVPETPEAPQAAPAEASPASTVAEAAPVQNAPAQQPKTLEESLNAGESVKPPKGASFIRATDSKGRESVVRVKDADTLAGAGPFAKVEYGTKGKSGFVPMKPKRRAVPRPRKTTQSAARPRGETVTGDASPAPPALSPEAAKVQTIAGNISLSEFERTDGYQPWEVTQQDWVNLQRAERRRLGQPEEDGTRAAPFS